MLTFVKLGGSIITDKRGQEAADLPIIGRLAHELSSGHQARHGLIIGHGSGSFGHLYAARYGVHRGLRDDANWMGFALTARATRRLHGILIDALLAAGIPALSLQPSASLRTSGGTITHWDTDTIAYALRRNLVPIIHGDISFDNAQGSAIVSTEALFSYLALHTSLKPDHMILVGETSIYTADPFLNPNAQPIDHITEENIDDILRGTTGSRAVDVTGGMHSKLAAMWRLLQDLPDLDIHIISARPGLLADTLRGKLVSAGSTHIHRNHRHAR